MLRLPSLILLLASRAVTAAEPDPTVGPLLERWRIPGAAVAIVEDGSRTVRGFGLADVANETAATGQTPFYLASTGKLFTALAVLREVESGRLNLHADINTWLDTFQVDNATYGRLTLHHLLTHTGGFDDRLIGYAARTADERRSLGDYLAQRLPPRVRPPGTVMGYSNHGYALAGHLVELASGLPFERRVAELVLEPLGMPNTGYVPLSPEHDPPPALGYRDGGAVWPLGYSHAVPAGGVASSAEDLARLMSALLNPGSGPFSTHLADQLMSRQAAHHPSLAGRGYALWEHHFGTEQGWIIGGAAHGFSSAMILVPEARLGVAVLLNRQEPEVALELAETLVGQRLNATEPDPEAMPMAGIERLAGSWRWVRHGSSSVERIGGHFAELRLEPISDRQLMMRGVGRDSKWLHIGEGVFAMATDPSRRLAVSSETPRPGHLYTNHLLTMPTAFERVHPLDTAQSRAAQALAILAVSLLAPIAFGVSAWRERRHDVRQPAPRTSGSLLAAAIFVFAVLVALSLRDFVAVMAYGPNLWLRAASLWPVVVLLALAAFIARVVPAWPHRSLLARLGYLWLIAAGLGTLGLAWHYHWWGAAS